MAYNVVYKKSVLRDLKKLLKAEVSRILDQIEQKLTEEPESYPVFKGQFTGLRKYRIGEYSVIYALVGTDILVLRIGNRRDVYKGES